MIGEYTYPFYHNSGKVCGRICMRAKGCSYHWKAKRRLPCISVMILNPIIRIDPIIRINPINPDLLFLKRIDLK